MHRKHSTLTIAMLFKEAPTSWGLRGDPYLWEELQEYFATAALPESAILLQEKIEQAFQDLTGLSMYESDNFLIPRFAHGGMSSGQICTKFWRESAVPLLMQRYEASFRKDNSMD
ncbi:MobA protein [Undibacterium sp. Di27W]|uniref:MobA protein n=1 Tax=Undibacterium sp. Di27W TaxID=3413036 RepID=UPI003BF3BA30